MDLLFVLISLPKDIKSSGMYMDLALECMKNGHNVTVISGTSEATTFQEEFGLNVLRVKSKPILNVGMIQKGIGMALLPHYYKSAYKKYLNQEKFDWIIMPTPPITLSGFVSYVKKKTGAKFYLILRDIHPQSVWSIGLLHNRIEYWFLDRKARAGYKAAEVIGCMSQGNIDFIKKEYPRLSMGNLELLYNWVKAPDNDNIDTTVRKKLGLDGKFVAMFGGNLGKGQRIENIIFLAQHYLSNPNIIFLVIAKGVEKKRLQQIARDKMLTNILFVDYMPQKDYLNLIKAIDLGLVSINENYKVPTCPSKAMSYMAAGVPVFAIINPNNDYGKMIEDSGAGYCAVGTDKQQIIELFDKIYKSQALRNQMSTAGKAFYRNNCTVDKAYHTMFNQMEEFK